MAHDLVLSVYAGNERLKEACKRAHISRLNVLAAFPERIRSRNLFLWLLAMVSIFFPYLVVRPETGMGNFVLIGTLVLIFMLIMHYCRALAIYNEYPTNLMIDSEGLKFRWLGNWHQYAPVISWEFIAGAWVYQHDLLRDNTLDYGKIVVLKVDTGRLTFDQRLWLMINGCRMADCLILFPYPFKTLKNFEFLEILIPLDCFTRETDKDVLLEQLQKKIDKKVQADSLKELIETSASGSGSEACSYTSMWLQDAKSNRARGIEALKAGDCLQERRYEISEKLATGGQATIYTAFDRVVQPSRKVVLKEFILPDSAGAAVRKRSLTSVENETRLLASLDHGGIVKLFDSFIESDRAYLVLEHVEGNSIREQVKSNGPLSLDRARDIIEQVGEILSYLHRQSPPVVHRDLTPDNLVVDVFGKVKLLDFNVAMQSESDKTRTVVGKYNYIAPEQFKGKPTAQSDLYSLGGVLYFMLVGRDPEALTNSRLDNQSICPVLASLVSGLTKLDLAERIESAEEMRTILLPRVDKEVEFLV